MNIFFENDKIKNKYLSLNSSERELNDKLYNLEKTNINQENKLIDLEGINEEKKI